MVALNSNGVYLAFNSINLSGYWTDQINKTASNATQEVTAGAGAEYVQRKPGLNDGNMAFAIVYDDSDGDGDGDISGYIGALEVGTLATLSYGPEGNAAGKPRFEGSMILQEVKGPNPTIDKKKWMWELAFEQAAAPTHRIENGDTY